MHNQETQTEVTEAKRKPKYHESLTVAHEELIDAKKASGIDTFAIEFVNPETGSVQAIACRKPNAEMYMRFGTESQGQVGIAGNNLMASCVIAPTMAELAPLLALYPALVSKIGGELLDAVGATIEVTSKKL